MSERANAAVMRAIAPPVSAPVLLALMLILAWASVPLGSNRAWSMAFLAALVLGLAFIVLMSRLWRLTSFTLIPAARLPLVLLSAWAIYTLLQSVALPMGVIRIISPSAHEMWSAAGVHDLATLSMDRGASLARGLHLASLAAIFALAVNALSNWQRMRFAAIVIVALGALQALIGVSVALGRSHGWLLSGPIEGVGGISGTYVNPNHFAGLLEMTLCVSVGLALSLRGPGLHFAGIRQFLLSLTGLLMSARTPLFAAQVLISVGLLWSGSRGALLSVTVAITVTFFSLLPVRPNLSASGRLQAFASIMAIVVLALAWGGPGALADKFMTNGISSNRLELAKATASLGADFALTGAGAGSFKSVFPSYKTNALGIREYEHAHNDYLEIFAEGGAIGLCLFLSSIGVCAHRTLRAARRRRGRAARAMCAGCVAGCLSLLVHACFDFNFQIPANASMFVFILAMGLAAASLARDPN
ncbi:MAG: putative inorganic carbon (HCO3(-)) transporter [Gammaproteobacteria bacterium]|jgi:putative inorganic carbon (HCO3(-)) transporter